MLLGLRTFLLRSCQRPATHCRPRLPRGERCLQDHRRPRLPHPPACRLASLTRPTRALAPTAPSHPLSQQPRRAPTSRRAPQRPTSSSTMAVTDMEGPVVTMTMSARATLLSSQTRTLGLGLLDRPLTSSKSNSFNGGCRSQRLSLVTHYLPSISSGLRIITTARSTAPTAARSSSERWARLGKGPRSGLPSRLTWPVSRTPLVPTLLPDLTAASRYQQRANGSCPRCYVPLLAFFL